MSTSEFSLQVNGLTIAGRRSGSAHQAPLVLLHGSGASSAVFAPQFASELSEVYQIVAFDLPGHGRSGDATDPTTSYSVQGMADVVGRAIDQLNLLRPAIYGWSMGGHVALELAAGRSDLAGLALSGTPPIGPGPIAALRGFHVKWDMLLASKESFSDRDAERFMRLCFGASGNEEFLADIKRADGRARVHFMRSLMRGAADERRFVQTSAVPVAMINGADDPIVRRSYIENLDYAALWRDACHIIPGASHAPFLEQPHAFNRLLHHFLRDLAIQPMLGHQSVASRSGR